MKLLLINSPIRLSAKPNCIPYGLAVIASTVREQGHEVEILDLNALRLSETAIVETLKNREWDIAGVSGLITTLAFQKWIIDVLKKQRPEAAVISGGGLATSVPEFLFENTTADIGVVGEGERTLPELMNAIENGDDIGQVKGVWHRNGSEVIPGKPRENVKDLDSLPFPAWDLLPMNIYLENPIWGGTANNSSGFKTDIPVSRSMNIITSRGCPYSCNYCYHLFGRSSFRFRSPQNIIDEMAILIDRYQVDFFGFNDDNTMASEKRLLEFCELVRQRNWKITWGCHGRVTSAKPEILKEMASAGCVWIGYGIESGSQEMLDRMNKKATVDQARKAIINTRNAGIYPNTTFIFGYPGETVDTIRESIEFKQELSLDCGSFFATPYPGTVLYEQSRSTIGDEETFIKSLGDATDFCVNLTDFDDEMLFQLKEWQDRNHVRLERSEAV